MHNTSFALVALALTALGVSASAQVTPPQTAACQAAQNLLEREFHGDGEARSEYALVTPRYVEANGLASEAATDPGVSWLADPIVVIESYEIVSTKEADGSAIVTVESVPLLHSTGHGDRGRSLVACPPVPERTQVILARKQGCWFAVDPPVPRISLQAVLLFYRSQVDALPDHSGKPGTFSAAQEDAFAKVRQTLAFLERLSRQRAEDHKTEARRPPA